MKYTQDVEKKIVNRFFIVVVVVAFIEKYRQIQIQMKFSKIL